jgi:hypothetical protein
LGQGHGDPEDARFEVLPVIQVEEDVHHDEHEGEQLQEESLTGESHGQEDDSSAKVDGATCIKDSPASCSPANAHSSENEVPFDCDFDFGDQALECIDHEGNIVCLGSNSIAAKSETTVAKREDQDTSLDSSSLLEETEAATLTSDEVPAVETGEVVPAVKATIAASLEEPKNEAECP